MMDITIEPPYVTRRPMFARDKDDYGIIKFSEISISYDFEMRSKMGDREATLPQCPSVKVEFRAKFI